MGAIIPTNKLDLAVQKFPISPVHLNLVLTVGTEVGLLKDNLLVV